MSDRQTCELIKVSRERLAEGHETNALYYLILALISQNPGVNVTDAIDETLRVFGWSGWLMGGPR